MISLERVVIFETSRVLKSHVFRQHFLLKNLVFGDQKWSIFGPKMVDFWSKKAIQKKDEIFDEIVVKMAATGRVTPGAPLSTPPRTPPQISLRSVKPERSHAYARFPSSQGLCLLCI